MGSIILVFVTSVAKSQEGEECPINNKKKEHRLDSLHLASKLPSKTRYWRKDRGKDKSDEKTVKKT